MQNEHQRSPSEVSCISPLVRTEIIEFIIAKGKVHVKLVRAFEAAPYFCYEKFKKSLAKEHILCYNHDVLLYIAIFTRMTYIYHR